jgi:hypothetical protein
MIDQQRPQTLGPLSCSVLQHAPSALVVCQKRHGGGPRLIDGECVVINQPGG